MGQVGKVLLAMDNTHTVSATILLYIYVILTLITTIKI